VKSAAIVALLATGCSFIGVRGAPPPCTDNFVLPIIDSVVASGGIVASAALVASDNPDSDVRVGHVLGGFAALAALPYVVSALYGLTKVSDCRAANRADANERRDVALEQKRVDALARETRRSTLARKLTDAAIGPPIDPPPASQSTPPVVRDPEVARKRARALFMTAAGAARTGECEAARERDPQVLALDADFHAKVFLADVGIKRCLAPAVTPSIDPTPAAPPPVAPVAP